MNIRDAFNHAPITARLGCENCGAEIGASSFALVTKQAETAGWLMRHRSAKGVYDWIEWYCPLCKPDFQP